LPEKNQTGRTWNARTWAKERKGWIFITSRPPERETLRPLHSLWIDLLVMRLLTAPQPEQKAVWFVIDELASLQKLPQLHTAITENRKSKNPLVLGFQGKAQLEVIYGHLAEVMLSQPATKIFMKTAEPKAAEWISEAIGKVEIERLKETKFDGSRSGKNFTVERQIEPLVMGSEITGLDDRHAYLKLGNNVARFAFDYLDLPTPTPGFMPRKSPDGEMSFDPDTLERRVPKPSPLPTPATGTEAAKPMANDAPLTLEKNPIPSPRQDASDSPNPGDVTRSEPISFEVAVLPDASTDHEALHGPEYVREL
jgi:type IV secretory pathway TraG/TraD family ATPase VirD4